jgi:hypothetical protein
VTPPRFPVLCWLASPHRGTPRHTSQRKLGLHGPKSVSAGTKLFSSLLTFGGQIWLFMLSANALLFFIALPVNNSDLQPSRLQGPHIKQSLITPWNICSRFKTSWIKSPTKSLGLLHEWKRNPSIWISVRSPTLSGQRAKWKITDLTLIISLEIA